MYWFWQKIKEQFFEEQPRWFLWVPVLFGSGIGIYFLLPQDYSIWWTLGFIEILIVSAVIFRFRPQVLGCLAVAALFVLGFTDIQLKAAYLNKKDVLKQEEETYLSGQIAKIDFNYRGNQRFILDDTENFENTRKFGKVRVSSRNINEKLKAGQCIEMVAKLMPVSKPFLPGGYQFDRKAYFEGINASGYAVSQIYETDCDKKASVWARFGFAVDELRMKIVKHIKQILPPDQASIAAAVIAGEQGVISRTVIQNYRDSGLAHFLSISGLHMSMIAGLMFFLIRFIMALIPPLALRFDSKKTAAVFAMLISIFYLFISGAQLPAQRAFIMNFIVVAGIFLGRRAISLRTISWAALIILVLSPQALIGASFQMSFAAVIALTAFYEKYAGALQRFLNGNETQSLWLKTVKVIWAYIIGILVADFVASLATLPFAVYHFNRISVYTTMTNLLAGPVIGLVIMPFVLIALLLMPFGLDYWPLKLVGWGIELTNSITAYVSSLPYAGYQVLSMPLWGLNLIVFGGLWLCLWKLSWRKWGVLLIVAGVLSIFTVKVPDVMIDEEASLVAVKDEQSSLVILPARGNNFVKQIWLEKTANEKLDAAETEKLKEIYKGKITDKAWLDLVCDKKSCIYKERVVYHKNKALDVDGKPFDAEAAAGAVFYLEKNKAEAKTVREDIGFRYWNKDSI